MSDLGDLSRTTQLAVATSELHEALQVAFELARDAALAGLVVTVLSPHRCQGAYGCHSIQLWHPDGTLWAEGTHETAESVREVIERGRG